LYEKYSKNQSQNTEIKPIDNTVFSFDNRLKNLEFQMHKDHDRLYNNNNQKSSMKNRKVRMELEDLRSMIFE